MNFVFDQFNFSADKIAIIDSSGTYCYSQLQSFSDAFATYLLDGKSDLSEARVAYMVEPGINYVSVQWGIWKSGGIAVPLALSYPLPSLIYVIEDTGAEIVVVSPQFESLIGPYAEERGIRLIVISDMTQFDELGSLPNISGERGAMILYTSGTTSLPKGVLTTHDIIESQISTLIKAWQWSPDDSIVCLLPLHHVHGIINVVSCALWSGAKVKFLHPFVSEEVFELFLNEEINVFMAVPTIYFKLIQAFDSFSNLKKSQITEAFKKVRLMVSGSAALPVNVMEKWKEISGHYLLERYGMTEIGMAISNPYEGERRAGYIGQPLPGVDVRLVDESNNLTQDQIPGEIQIKGPSVFKEYWKKSEATARSFTPDGWFKTGDIAVIEDGYFRILGRDSVDIIKSGGYKISALEIEEVLRKHPSIKDCAVVGIPNEEWGELVVGALVIQKPLEIKDLEQWIRSQMPAYKTPKGYKIMDDLPRNAMGKVVKTEVKAIFS
jgi:malonyl-CoA/methylmalonyl-CoA synthetase